MANHDITHTELIERPKHKVSLNVEWQATKALSFTATAIYTGKWADINRDGTAPGLFATPYTLINLTSNYGFGNGVSFFAHRNNLLDRHYQDPIGIQHQGFGVFAIKLAFDVPTAIPGIMPGAAEIRCDGDHIRDNGDHAWNHGSHARGHPAMTHQAFLGAAAVALSTGRCVRAIHSARPRSSCDD
jgi:hypothetical protein